MLRFKRFVEQTELVESHFEVGDKVKCVHSGKEGVVTKVDPSEKGKYYTVKRDDGEVMQYAPDDLEALKEEVELDEAGYKVPKNYASMMAKKRRKAGTSEFGTHPDKKKEVKKEEIELEEGRNEALKALEGLAKRGGMDKADFQKAHDLYKANKLTDLRKHIYGLDTDPSEAIADVINRHDSKAFNSMYPKAKAGDYLRMIILNHGGK